MSDWTPPADIAPWMVCAACRIPGDPLIFTGPRHFDETMHALIGAAGYISRCREMEQGFIDQWGRFYTREEALEATKRSGQPVNFERQGGIKYQLFSEGLY